MSDTPPGSDWLFWFGCGGFLQIALGALDGARGAWFFFFTDYLSHVLLSGHSDNFSKYNKKSLLYRLPAAALTWLCGKH